MRWCGAAAWFCDDWRRTTEGNARRSRRGLRRGRRSAEHGLLVELVSDSGHRHGAARDERLARGGGEALRGEKGSHGIDGRKRDGDRASGALAPLCVCAWRRKEDGGDRRELGIGRWVRLGLGAGRGWALGLEQKKWVGEKEGRGRPSWRLLNLSPLFRK